MKTLLTFNGNLTPRQAKGAIIGGLGLFLFGASAIAAAGHPVAALGVALPVLTAIFCVNQEA